MERVDVAQELCTPMPEKEEADRKPEGPEWPDGQAT